MIRKKPYHYDRKSRKGKPILLQPFMFYPYLIPAEKLMNLKGKNKKPNYGNMTFAKFNLSNQTGS